MPELPEVETIRLQLKNKISNKKIKEVIINDKRLIKGISAAKFKSQLDGKTIRDILRRGKVIIIKLENKFFLIIHLPISGWLILSKKDEKFSRVVFKLSDGKLWHFCDRRALGHIMLVDDWQKLSLLKEMGPEPLKISEKDFIKLFEGKKTKIKPLLMDQKFLAGVGNVYAQEAVFCAKIHPERRVDQLDKKDLARVYSCLTSILKKAITKKGSSVDTYRQLDGKAGEFVPLLKVYQRGGKKCTRCSGIIKRKAIGGRGTYFCPKCQK